MNFPDKLMTFLGALISLAAAGFFLWLCCVAIYGLWTSEDREKARLQKIESEKNTCTQWQADNGERTCICYVGELCATPR